MWRKVIQALGVSYMPTGYKTKYKFHQRCHQSQEKKIVLMRLMSWWRVLVTNNCSHCFEKWASSKIVTLIIGCLKVLFSSKFSFCVSLIFVPKKKAPFLAVTAIGTLASKEGFYLCPALLFPCEGAVAACLKCILALFILHCSDTLHACALLS